MNKTKLIIKSLFVACCAAQSSAFAFYDGDPGADLLAPNQLQKNGAKQLVVRYEPAHDTVETDAVFIDGVGGGKKLWTKACHFTSAYNPILQGISATAEGAGTIRIVEYIYGPEVIRRFGWDGKNITLLSQRSDDRLANCFKNTFNRACQCSRKDYDKNCSDQTEEIEYWWLYFSRDDLTSLITKVDKKALASYQKHDLQGAIDRLYCGLDCAAMYGGNLASHNGSKKEINLKQAKPLVWLDSFVTMDIKMPGDSADKTFSYKSSNYIPAVNNYAYFLQLQGKHAEVIPIFQKILTIDPERMVAYLNLADSLWAVGEKSKATDQYKEYLSRVQSLHVKDIPLRVKERSIARP